jgi:hypothetical protein
MVDRLREKMDADRLPVAVGDMATTRIDGESHVSVWRKPI